MFTTRGGPGVGAFVSAGGEAAELAICPELGHLYLTKPQTANALCGRPVMRPGHLFPPAHLSDCMAVYQSARVMYRADVVAFGREASEAATDLVGRCRPDVLRWAAKLQRRCDRAGVAGRSPPDGLDGDGPQWLYVSPHGPSRTLMDVLLQIKRGAGAAPARPQLRK